LRPILERRLIVDNRHSGIEFEISYDGSFRDNVIAGDGSVGLDAGIYVRNSVGATAYRNVVTDNHNEIVMERDPLKEDTGCYGSYDLAHNRVYGNAVTMTRGFSRLGSSASDPSYLSSRGTGFEGGEWRLDDLDAPRFMGSENRLMAGNGGSSARIRPGRSRCDDRCRLRLPRPCDWRTLRVWVGRSRATFRGEEHIHYRTGARLDITIAQEFTPAVRLAGDAYHRVERPLRLGSPRRIAHLGVLDLWPRPRPGPEQNPERVLPVVFVEHQTDSPRPPLGDEIGCGPVGPFQLRSLHEVLVETGCMHDGRGRLQRRIGA
jgi:hypothetical protein